MHFSLLTAPLVYRQNEVLETVFWRLQQTFKLGMVRGGGVQGYQKVLEKLRLLRVLSEKSWKNKQKNIAQWIVVI